MTSKNSAKCRTRIFTSLLLTSQVVHGQHWADARQALGRCRADTGAKLGRHWADAGPTLGRCWASTGLMRGQHWADAGPTPGRCWADAVPILASNGPSSSRNHNVYRTQNIAVRLQTTFIMWSSRETVDTSILD